MEYTREISNKIMSLSKEFPALALTGARQVGKTTLLKKLFPHHSYVSLDIPSTADLAENNPDLFLKRYSVPLVIDEVQYAPKLFRHLKIWIDQNRNQKGQLIMTGSQKFNLMKEVSESLAGRVALLELEPLSLFELQQHEAVSPNHYPTFMVRGFFPELWKEKSRSITTYYHSYLNTYIERDVRQIVNIGNTLDFEKFIRVCAGRTGQILVKSELAKDVGVTVNTINSWLSVLEASNQILFVQPYFENFGKRLVKSPKMFFADTGLLIFLLGLDEESLLSSPLIGSLWENLVFIELRKRWLASNSTGHFWYYRDQLAREVDLLFVSRGKVHFIETKWTTSPDLRSATKIETIASDLKSKNVKRGSISIIARNKDPLKVTHDCTSYNLMDFLLP